MKNWRREIIIVRYLRKSEVMRDLIVREMRVRSRKEKARVFEKRRREMTSCWKIRNSWRIVKTW